MKTKGKFSLKIVLLFYFFLFFQTMNIFAQVKIDWDKWLDYQNQDVPVKMALDKNNNIYIAGVTDDGYDFDYLLTKYNSSGELQWVRKFNGSGNWNDEITDICVDDSSNIYVTGYMSTNFGTTYCTLKYDTTGSLIWQRTFSRTDIGFNWGRGNNVLVDKYGYVYVTGFLASNSAKEMYTLRYDNFGGLKNILFPETNNIYDTEGVQVLIDNSNHVYVCYRKNESDNYRISIIKYDSNMKLLWNKSFSNTDSIYNFAQVFTLDKQKSSIYVLSASCLSSVNGFCIFKIDTTGTLIWTKEYSSDDVEFSSSNMTIDDNNNVLVVGNFKSNFESRTNIFIMKTSAKGELLWKNEFVKDTLDLIGIKLQSDNNNNIYVASSIYSINPTDMDILIAKYDSSGIFLWEEKYDYPIPGSNEEPIDFVLVNEDELIITGRGSSKSEYWNPFEIITIKYIPFMSDIVDTKINLNKFELFQNYPNPFNPSTTISYSTSKTSQVKIIVYDIMGDEIRTLVDEEKSQGNYKIEFNASGLSSGVYYYSIFVNNYLQTKKMILIK